MPGLRILVVDDNADAARLLSDSLQALGHRAVVAFDGPSALERASAFHPDVVLLDLGLPVMDGFEVAQRLKALPERGRLEVVAITGYGQDIDRQRTRESGFDEHMVKTGPPGCTGGVASPEPETATRWRTSIEARGRRETLTSRDPVRLITAEVTRCREGPSAHASQVA